MVNVAGRLPTIGRTREVAGGAQSAGGCDARGAGEYPNGVGGAILALVDVDVQLRLALLEGNRERKTPQLATLRKDKLLADACCQMFLLGRKRGEGLEAVPSF